MTVQDESEIAREILAYLSDNPGSKDTLEGIVQWWLMERKIKFHISLVKEALADLVGRGLILESKRGKSNPNYKLNHKKADDITEFLDR